ncbi:MAG: hypothetical protein VX831_03295 [Candidatus Thermoplasmatota archaeon]|nr:hypothetical protein [Candidatus Thermoplasmatota archaeon]
MDPKYIVEAPASKYTAQAQPPGEPVVAKVRQSRAKADLDEDNPVLPDALEEFLEDDAIQEDLIKHPVIWLLSLLVFAPALLQEIATANERDLPSFLEPVELLAPTVVILAPAFALMASLRGHIGPTLLASMGASAAVLANQAAGSWLFGDAMLAIVVSLGLIGPLVLVLHNKKKLLDPGKARQAWCTLMATSIVLYAYGTFYRAAERYAIGVDPSSACSDGLFSSLCSTNRATELLGEGGSLGLVGMAAIVAAVGWAWPRGKHIINETAETVTGMDLDGDGD